MMAILIGLGISLAIGGLVYLNYEDEIDEARRLAEENGFDLDEIDFSDFARSAEVADVPKTEALDEEVLDAKAAELEDEPLPTQTFARAQAPSDPPLEFEPEQEQLVVELDADIDLKADATNLFDPETETTSLSIGEATVLRLSGDQTDVSIGFGTQSETESGLSPFDIVLVQNRMALT